MFESNYLTMLVKPNYEKPVDSPEDVRDRGLNVIWFPYYEYYKEMAIEQNVSVIERVLALKTIVAKVSIQKVKKNTYHRVTFYILDRIGNTMMNWLWGRLWVKVLLLPKLVLLGIVRHK